MTGISWEGSLALAVVVFGGPAIWGVNRAVLRCRGRTMSEIEMEKQVSASACEGREQTDRVSYLMTLLGYAIGIGNLWRFPYLVGKWGGGAFVIAYLCCMMLVAAPLYLMELGMGHYTRKSTLDCFRAVHPRWVGLGLAQSLMIFFCLTYFNVLIAYCAIYVADALANPLPWSPEAMFGDMPVPAGATGISTSAAEQFWRHDVLNQYSGSLEGLGLGALQWKLVVALGFVWLVVFVSLAFGKKILAQVTWVTVIGPVILLCLMLFQSLRLPGAGDGVKFYIGKFEMEKLMDIELWATACSQILFSLSPGFGTAITMSSFVDQKVDVFSTCMIVTICNSTFSITGGFAIFGILGNLALRTGKTVAEVASSSGPGLAFIAIADGMRTFGDGANAMAVLFFVMLMALGLDSTFAWAETLASIVEDHFIDQGRTVSKKVIVGVICLLLFLCGLPYCTRMGGALLDVVDHFVGSMFLLFACCVEVFMFNFQYKFRRLVGGLYAASRRPLCMAGFWRFCYWVPVPLGTGCLFLHLLMSAVIKPYGEYPRGLQALGWALLATCIAATLSTALSKGSSALIPFEAPDDEENRGSSSEESSSEEE